MGVKKKITGLAIGAFLSNPVRKARGRIHDVKRRVKREGKTVELYFQADDPQSYLLAQLVPRLAEKYDVDWEMHVVPPPAPDVDPAPSLRRKFLARDARELATFWDVEFPDGPDELDVVPVQRANQVLIKKRPFEEQLEAALVLGDALWRKDKNAIAKAQGTYQFEASGNIGPSTQLAYARMRKRGFYTGGAFYYQGEWYPGLDRLVHLEARLDAEHGLEGAPSVLQPVPPEERPPALLAEPGEPLVLELFFSFRSPYSYLAIDRSAALCERYGIELKIRPILPMVTRGLPVPMNKRLFIVRDAKREADRLEIPFGRICDPLGAGVERCMAFFRWAARENAELAFTRSAAQGIWSEALDPSAYADMKKIVTRAGLDWNAMRGAADDDGWQEEVAANAEDHAGTGLWGVPTFRIGNYTTWGQDRIPTIEDRLRRHQAAVDAGE